MKSNLLNLCVLFTLFLAACTPAAPVITPTIQTPPVPTTKASDVPTPTSFPTSAPVPESVLLVGQTLAQQLHIQQSQVAIASLENQTWDNDCLDVMPEGAACTSKATQGYSVVFQVSNAQYTFHLDEAGDIVRLASAPSPQVGNPIISWQFTDTICQAVLIGDEGIAFGECNAPMIASQLTSEDRKTDLEFFNEAFFPFQADTPAGKIIFTGKGTQKPTLAEKRMVAEWARLVYTEALTGHSGASYGLSFAWHREGGFAGFCDDISVYLTGEIYATSCKSGTAAGLGRSRLDAAQLAQIYAWVDKFKNFEISHSDGEGVPDSLTTYLTFSGAGTEQPTEEDQQAILEFAADLYAGFTPAGANTDLDSARQALSTFFQLLNDGNYKEAAGYFGGSYSSLISMNPDLPTTDFAALLENGCTNNGLQCKLVREIIKEEQMSPQEFKFTIEFSNDDGSLFTVGSCCGEEATVHPLQSQFEYTVFKDGDQFMVQELPQYVP
jgi:hypothetical protein